MTPKHGSFPDTYSTVNGHSDRAHVVSATIDKKTGKRNEYDLTYCYCEERDNFLVTGCGCLGFLSAKACRHAVGLFDVLNLPFIKLHLAHTPKTEVLKAEVSGLCVQCSSETLSITLYIGGKGYLSADACTTCHRVIIH